MLRGSAAFHLPGEKLRDGPEQRKHALSCEQKPQREDTIRLQYFCEHGELFYICAMYLDDRRKAMQGILGCGVPIVANRRDNSA